MRNANHPDSQEWLSVSLPPVLVGGSDQIFRDMLRNLMSILSRLEHVRGCLGGFVGVSGIQFTLLATIRHLQGGAGVGVKKLADHLGLSAPFVTQETSRLVREGLLTKTTNPADLRRVLLVLTDEGMHRLERLAPIQRQINDVLFAPLDRADFAHLGRILRNLHSSAAQGAELADHLFEANERSV